MKQKTLFLIIFITLSGFTGTKYNQIAGETTLYNTVYKVVQPDGDIRESWAINKALNKVSQAGEAIELKNPAYNVTFSARGITVTPTSGGPQLSWSADFKEPVAPRFDDDKIVYERGSVVEQYLIKQSTIEQQFIIHKPLNPKEAFFSISGTVQSKGEFEPTRNGWRWKNELGAVSLGDVTVFDASKKKFPARMEVTKDGTSITLETKFYQDAVYPITIDPEFGSDDFRISHVGPDTETVGYSGTNASVAFCPISTVSYPKGIYMVVWVGNVSGKNDIYGQRIDGKTGALIGGEIRICNMGPDNTSYAASAPDVAASGSEFFVVWSGDDASIADDKFEIFGQRVGAVAGTLSGSRVRISTTWTDNTAAYDASSPAVAYNSTWSPGSIDGSYLVVWHADHVFDDQNEIFSQGVDTQGNLISTNKRVSNMGTDGNALYDALRPDVVWNSTANTYLVAWHGDHEAVGDTQNEIFVRRVDGSDAGHGNVLGTSEVRISDMGPSGNTSYTALDAAVAYNSTNNNFLVAWHGDDDALGVNDEFEIYGQIVSSTGTVVSANNFFRISSMGTNGLTAYAGQNASVTYDPLFNHYFVSWHGDDNTSPLIDNENEIFGQVLDNAGAAVGSRTRISQVGGSGNTTYSATFSAAAYNSLNNESLVAWHGDNSTAVDNELEVWGQRFAELSPEPIDQPTAPIFDLITALSSTVSFSEAGSSPDGYIVLRKAGSSPGDVPADHQVYAVDDMIGTSRVVHVGDLLSFTQGGLVANTIYHYDFFAYNGVNSSTNYRTASPLEASFSTLFAEPGTQGTFSFSTIGTNSIQVNLIAGNGSNRLLVAKAGSAVNASPIDALTYTPDNNFGSGPNLGSSNYVVGNGTGTVTVTGLSPATVYHFKVFEYSGTLLLTNYNTDVIANSTGSRSTFATEPTDQPDAPVNFTSITTTSFSVGFGAASPTPAGYIAIRKQGSAPAQPGDMPVDGTTYSVGDGIGGSTVAYIGTAASFNQSSLTPGTEYYYLILAYSGTGANTNYLTTSPISGSQFTLATEPGTQATNISFSALNTTSMTVGWSNGNGSERLVVAREVNAVSFTPSDGTAYTGNSNFTGAADQGSGNKVVYRGNGNSVALTNLTAGTVYHFRVYELNGTGLTTNYITSTPSGNPNSRSTLANEPGTQASGISFASIAASSVQVNFTSGNGTSRFLVARSGAAVNANPTDGTTYTANNAFGTPASELGTGNYVVGAGSGPITVTGLSANTTYHFRVYEFSGASGSENYNVTTPSGNPASTTTLASEPTQATSITFTALADNALTVSWTNGGGSERLVVARQGSAVSVNPADGTSYTGNPSFTTATDLGSGNKVVFRGSGNSVAVTNLAANTVYHFRVYELNGTGSLCNYNIGTPTGNPNSRTTLATEPSAQPGTISFSAHTTAGVTLDFPHASGPPTGYLIIRKVDSPSGGSPVDGTTYTVGGSLDGTIVAIGSSNQFVDAGLTAGTTYHYKIFSFNGTGATLNYRTADSRTGSTITLPNAPTAQPATDVGQSSFTANWTAVPGATNYRLDVSVDNFGSFVPGFNSAIVSAAVTFQSVGSLSASTEYKYRVRAENSSGQSVSSNVVSLTTDAPSSGALAISPTILFSDLGPSEDFVEVSVDVTGGTGAKTVQLFRKGITSAVAHDPLLMSQDGNTFSVNVEQEDFDELGVEFFIRASDASANPPLESLKKYMYRSFAISTQAIPSIVRHGGTKKSYQMISIPFKLNDEGFLGIFGEELGAYDKTKWRLVRWQSNTEEYVDPPSFNNKIEQGKSYWFNSADEVNVLIPAGTTRTTPELHQSSPFKMNLLAGWNQIANPYRFNIDWDDVLAANGSPAVGNYFIFNSSALDFTESNTVEPFEGGFVFTANAITLDIPVTLKNTAGGRKSKARLRQNIDEEEWTLPLTLVQGDVKNTQGGIGMYPQANTSKDQWDDVTLPRFVQYLETNFYHPEFFWPKFSKDIVPTTEEHEWNLSIESNGEGNIELQWDALAIAGAQANLFLYDEAEGRLIDMKVQSWFTIPQGSRKDLKLIYTQKDEYIPNNTMLGKTWPNPANNEVNIPVVLAGTAHSYNVEVDVYDLKGIKQKTVGVGEYNAGIHSALWDIKDAHGNDVTSGVYIVKLKVNGRYLPDYSKVIVNRSH